MEKNKLIILLLFLTTNFCLAQAKFGVKAGATISKFTTTVEDLGFEDSYNYKTGFYAGIFTKAPIGKKFSIQADILFSQTGTEFSYQDNNLLVERTVTQYSVSTPITIQYNLSKIFFIEVGGQANFILKREYVYDAYHPSFDIFFGDQESLPNNIVFGYLFGIGFNITDNINFSGRYFIEAKNENNEIARVFYVGVGYSF